MDAPAPGEAIGRYRIYGRIGSGGMASVHLGRLVDDGGFSRAVAVKRLHPHLADDPSFLAAIIDEARLAARVRHPNVVPTIDVVRTDSEVLIVMEYIRGEALSRLLAREAERDRLMPPPVACAVVVDALRGLHAAHEATDDRGEPLGIVHRDVSPHNILVGVDGAARVIDFGIAKASGRLQTTREGVLKGRIAYMAPEQLAGAPVTRAVDIYAAGVVLWESLACRRLYHGDSDFEVAEQVERGSPEPPSRYAANLPPLLDTLVMKALAPSPDDRFRTAIEMADRLVEILPPASPGTVGDWCAEVAAVALATRGALVADVERSSMTPAALPARPHPPLASRRTKLAALAGAGALVAGSIGLATWLRQGLTDAGILVEAESGTLEPKAPDAAPPETDAQRRPR